MVAVRDFEVVHGPEVAIRKEPSLKSAPIAAKARGARFSASEETFDGWVQLWGESGWILRDMKGKKGLGVLLSPCDSAREDIVLAADEMSEVEGPQTLEVVFEQRVPVRKEPSTKAEAIDVRQPGEKIQAISQTYDGWVRLVDNKGFMLAVSKEHGRLLYAPYVGEQRRRRQELEDSRQALERAKKVGDLGQLEDAIKLARNAGVDNETLDIAEKALEEVRQIAEARQALIERISQSAKEGDEQALVACIEEAKKLRLHQAEADAQENLDLLRERRRHEEETQAVALKMLAEAATTGDPEKIRAAIEEAKKSGVPKREIARTHALNSGR